MAPQAHHDLACLDGEGLAGARIDGFDAARMTSLVPNADDLGIGANASARFLGPANIGGQRASLCVISAADIAFAASDAITDGFGHPMRFEPGALRALDEEPRARRRARRVRRLGVEGALHFGEPGGELLFVEEAPTARQAAKTSGLGRRSTMLARTVEPPTQDP